MSTPDKTGRDEQDDRTGTSSDAHGAGEPEGGPGKADSTGAGSGRVAVPGVDRDDDEHAEDRGAGKDDPTPNPAQIAP